MLDYKKELESGKWDSFISSRRKGEKLDEKDSYNRG